MPLQPCTSVADVRVALDRPPDRLLTDRIELLTGWLAPVEGEFALTAACGDRELGLRPCWHPIRASRPDVQGFWGFLVVQELLDRVRHGYLDVELFWGRAHLETLHLRVSPVASHLAIHHPHDLSEYPVPRLPAATGRGIHPHTIVFPGLGGTGGASLNQLLRMKMFREGWPVPVHFEADVPALWASLRAQGFPAFRWIDGHRCYGAGVDLGRSFARATLLRDPVRRLVSVFNYNSLVHPDDFPFATFEEFLASGTARQHTQAAGLLRCAGVPVERGLPDRELYALATEELRQQYALVGVTELFEETIFLLCQLAGYDSIGMWWRVLAAPRGVDPDALSGRAGRQVEDVVAVDRALYDDAKQRLEERLARSSLGIELQRYKERAAQRRELPEEYKLIECLRWRQILVEAELRALKGAQSGPS